MGAAKDIMLTNENVLRIENGDYVIDYSDGQHVRHMLYFNLGTVRQFPLVGLGIRRAVNTKYSARDIMNLKKDITTQMVGDGYKTPDINFSTTQFSIDYERL